MGLPLCATELKIVLKRRRLASMVKYLGIKQHRVCPIPSVNRQSELIGLVILGALSQHLGLRSLG